MLEVTNMARFVEIRNRREKIAENFVMSEFYSTSWDSPRAHSLDKNLIDGIQQIRSYFNVKIEILSSYRTAVHQEFLFQSGQGSKVSQHSLSRAVDFKFIGAGAERASRELQSAILGHSPLFRSLRSKFGFTGFGLYPTFFHVDTRVTNFSGRRDGQGLYNFWDYREKKK